MLTAGEVIKFRNGIWLVLRVNAGSAYVTPLTGKQKPITTRKKFTKMVMDYPAPTHISANSMVERVDPKSAFALQARRRFMGEVETINKEDVGTVPTDAGKGGDKKQAARATQIYVRTEKETKEMKGQGAIVMEALDRLQRGTVEDFVKDTTGKFQTRQDEARVVGFYLSKFKREGFATVIQPEPVAKAAKKGEEPATEIEG
jgi:hypothetical protein